jgi:putative hydrolase of HD superfamily
MPQEIAPPKIDWGAEIETNGQMSPDETNSFNRQMDLAYEAVNGLNNIHRTGWVARGIPEKESETVGEHTQALIDLANQLFPDREDLDHDKLLRMLQIHDWPENITGDKRAITDDEAKRIKFLNDKKLEENVALRSICLKLGEQGKIIFKLWQEFEDQKTPEAKIAKQLDKLQCMLKAWEYEQQGQPIRALDFTNYKPDQKIVSGEGADPVIKKAYEELLKAINQNSKKL